MWISREYQRFSASPTGVVDFAVNKLLREFIVYDFVLFIYKGLPNFSINSSADTPPKK